MARIRPTIALRNDRAGRNKRKRPASTVTRTKMPFWQRVNWSKVRLWSVSLAFAGLWVLLWARAYQIQIIRGPRYAEEARRAHIATEVATGRRGSILDRNGNVLAKSVEARSVAVRPNRVTDKEAAARLLASALNIAPAKAKKIVTDKRSFVWAARKVGPRAVEAIQAANLSGIYLQKEYERVYPFKHLAGQLVGFADVDEKGIEGLELAFNDTLSGQKKRLVMQRDAAGRRLYSGAGEGMHDLAGENVVLTIDTQVQYFAESALLQGVENFGARWAGCMVVDVPSGDILAWAEYPFFNPNRPSASSAFERRNKTAMDALEQGSTIKPFLMAAALQEKIVTPESEYDCEKGKWKLHNVTIRDTSVHAVLPAKDIIKFSSNIGMAKIGLELGTAKYHRYLTRLGFGARTGLPLAGENPGIVRPAKQWGEVDLASAAFGQSFSATIVQMAQAYLCIANDGVKKDLRLVFPAADEQKKTAPGERLFSREVMWQVREMMRSTVEDSGGTARRARIDGLSVGGKTGTAQKASGDAYGAGRVASFVGMLPVEAPRYLVVVMLDEPVKNQYGGVVAAPVFKNVAMRTMAYHGLLPESAPLAALAELRRERQAQEAAGQPGAPQGEATEEERVELVNVAQAAAGKGSAPSVVGLSARKAVEAFARQGLVPEIKGDGNIVVRQVPEPGVALSAQGGKTQCVIWLGDRS
ncbi:PASTA domain-containing protein [Desulfovibrio sp. OttesenSCG-928-O18]|nr:PASTA domain-containing protein [Desulfovibrio sp. OttesenSCG-928-O18]